MIGLNQDNLTYREYPDNDDDGIIRCAIPKKSSQQCSVAAEQY